MTGPADATVSQCVIQADDPAALLRVFDGQSLLWWLLREFIRFGVTDFLLLLDQVPTGIADTLPRRVGITAAPPSVGAGSGGALFQVRDRLRDRFLLCDADALFDWNLGRLLAADARGKPDILGRIVRFDGSARRKIALFRHSLVEHLRPVCSLEEDVLPGLARRGLTRTASAASWGDGIAVSQPIRPRPPGGSRLDEVAATAGQSADGTVGIIPASANPLRRRALFLDRDGVLNVDHGYVGSRDRFEWIDGALDAIRCASEAGWHVFVVTNQSGVARGHYTEQAVRDLLGWMAGQARAAGGTIDDARFCPFHPQAPVDAYRQAHPWRKPLPGMLLDLIDAWELAPEQAVMVGDQETDMRAAAAAGVAGHLFGGGDLLRFLTPLLHGDASSTR